MVAMCMLGIIIIIKQQIYIQCELNRQPEVSIITVFMLPVQSLVIIMTDYRDELGAQQFPSKTMETN